MCIIFFVYTAQPDPGEELEVVKAKYFIRDEFLVSWIKMDKSVLIAYSYF